MTYSQKESVVIKNIKCPGESPPRGTVWFGPFVGQEDWSKELSLCVYADTESTAESTTSWYAQAERGHF